MEPTAPVPAPRAAAHRETLCRQRRRRSRGILTCDGPMAAQPRCATLTLMEPLRFGLAGQCAEARAVVPVTDMRRTLERGSALISRRNLRSPGHWRRPRRNTHDHALALRVNGAASAGRTLQRPGDLYMSGTGALMTSAIRL